MNRNWRIVFAGLLIAGQAAFGFSDDRAGWSCKSPVWTKSPDVSGGMFTGTLEAECTFDAVAGGTFSDLLVGLEEEVKDKALKIHKGPESTTYAGMPATYFDATTEETVDNMTARIRGDLYLATDGQSRLVSASASKEIQASGMAKNLKFVSFDFEIRPEGESSYKVRMATSLKVQKPGIAPVGIFKKQVMEGAQNQLKDRQEPLIKAFVEYL